MQANVGRIQNRNSIMTPLRGMEWYAANVVGTKLIKESNSTSGDMEMFVAGQI